MVGNRVMFLGYDDIGWEQSNVCGDTMILVGNRVMFLGYDDIGWGQSTVCGDRMTLVGNSGVFTGLTVCVYVQQDIHALSD